MTQLASFNFVTEKIDVNTVSSDGSEATDRDAAEAIDLLLQCVDKHMPEGVHAKIFGSLSDTGGAGVGERLMEQSQEIFDRIHVGSYTLTCVMHTLAHAFQVAFEAAFGKSGLGCKILLQWLHTMWSIQEALGEEFKTVWEAFAKNTEDDKPTKRLVKPLLTQWMYVLNCGKGIFIKWNKWMKFLVGTYKSI